MEDHDKVRRKSELGLIRVLYGKHLGRRMISGGTNMTVAYEHGTCAVFGSEPIAEDEIMIYATPAAAANFIVG